MIFLQTNPKKGTLNRVTDPFEPPWRGIFVGTMDNSIPPFMGSNRLLDLTGSTLGALQTRIRLLSNPKGLKPRIASYWSFSWGNPWEPCENRSDSARRRSKTDCASRVQRGWRSVCPCPKTRRTVPRKPCSALSRKRMLKLQSTNTRKKQRVSR